MATRPDVSAFTTHEERVRAFMASVPKRRRDRVAAKYRVLEDEELKAILQEERPWAPGLLDQMLTPEDGPVYRTPHKGEPTYLD